MYTNRKYTILDLTFLILLLGALFACGETQNSPAHTHDHATEGHSHSHEPETMDNAGEREEVSLTREQLENIGVEYTALKSRQIRSLVKLSGRVELPPSGKAVVGSNLEGKISAVHVISGQEVRKGQKLFTLENLNLIDWQRDLQNALAKRDLLTKELDRQKKLSEEELAPTKLFDEAVTKLEEKDNEINALVAKLNVLGISPGSDAFQSTFSILAPASGIIQHLMVSNGQYIREDIPLAEIINNHHLHLHLSAFGRDVITLKKNQILKFYVQSRPADLMNAKIRWINALVDEQNNSYDVHADIIDDHSRLSAGEFVEARVIDQEKYVSAIPLKAVSTDRGLKYIFVKEDEHDAEVHFKKIQVALGESDLGFVEVIPIDPLPEVGDSVIVSEGAFFLMAESKKGEEGAGHSH